ncbi:NmrA family NAD(P)-binding protein [Paraburkholderia sp. J12]|uniref:NmrA family NAD(P)-binding protein n=1 Tax=Paraburkholderia sp. J12 TaxID=2805432 RepID=UPI002ABDB286|nr:NmrA family NAD(P)-binding protein [Paraburkholderia sp. J12]
MGTYTLIGATGNVGSLAAARLLAAGQTVRPYLRNEAHAQHWRERGAQPFVGDLYDTGALVEAFSGADAAYLMTPTWFTADDMFVENERALDALSEAVSRAHLQRVVLLSSIGAHRPHGTGAILKLHAMERRFARLPHVTSIRAGWFMENYAGLVARVAETGVLPSMLSPLDMPVPMVATADVGAAVAGALTSVWSGQRVVELEGPRRYSPDDVAATLAKVLGRAVQAQVLPETQWRDTWTAWGLTQASASAMSEMLRGFNEGWITFERPQAETTPGGTSLESVLAGLVARAPQ